MTIFNPLFLRIENPQKSFIYIMTKGYYMNTTGLIDMVKKTQGLALAGSNKAPSPKEY